MSIFLMFIGASPGGTGGGIKSTTFYIIALSAWLNIKGLNRIEIGKRTIPDQLVGRAYSIFIFATTYNLIAVFLLSITEANTEGADILTLLFEQISAFSTVGLSLGITSSLTTAGKFILIVTMYIGRVGTITLALALSEKVLTTSYRYPDGYVMVG
jgi:Trk-type K+ transport system membrane component